MAFIERDKTGAVIAAWSEKQYASQVELSPTDPGLYAFLNRSPLSIKLAGLDLTADDVAQIVARPGMYVDFDSRGLIVGAYDAPQRAGQPKVPLDLPKLRDFLAGEPAPVAPRGYSFVFNGGTGKFRVLRESDNVALIDGLESWAACAAAASKFTNARAKN